MFRALRFIVWFLLAAVPLQGAAAVTLLHCAATHDRMAQNGERGLRISAPHVHAAGESVQHHGSTDAVRPGDLAQHEPPGVPYEGAFTCSSCAACCCGASIVQCGGSFDNPVVSNDVSFTFVPVRYSDHTPDRLDRPPLALLV